MATPIVAEIASDWIASGTADRLLAAQRSELAIRNRLAQRILGPDCSGHLYGLHRWLPLPETCDESAVLKQALRHEVAVAPGSGFAVIDRSPALRICLGAPKLRELERGLTALAAVLPNSDAGRSTG